MERRWHSNEGRQGFTLASNKGVSGQVIRTREPLIVNDYTHWDGRATVLVDNPSSAVMGVPLLIRDQVVGILLVIANSEERTFSSDDVHMAEMFAAQAAATLHNAQIYTAAQQALAKEKELNDLKSRFISMASHEFPTPLATILALAETLSAYRHKLEEEEIEKLLEKIKDQVGHLKDMMEDVLLLGRMQVRRVQFNPTLLDLNALCRAIIDEFRSQPDVNHRLIYSGVEGNCTAVLDQKLMRQILTNLLSNAIKYSSADKAIYTDLECTESSIALKVRDEGIGIPEADQAGLFTAFRRASNVGSIAGIGLGLAIVKQAVDLLRGTIELESRVGIGTTVTVRIPA